MKTVINKKNQALTTTLQRENNYGSRSVLFKFNMGSEIIQQKRGTSEIFF